MKDRIELSYEAIDEMICCHGTKRPKSFGGGKWDMDEEWKEYKKQVGDRYTKLQWNVMGIYFEAKKKRMKV